jgi:hypothetical protein
MSLLDLLGAAPRSRRLIEQITQDFLSKTQSYHLARPGKLDVERLLDLDLHNLYGFDIEIVGSLKWSVEAQVLPFERKIQFTEEGYKKLLADDRRSRFTGCHEAYHVIDHCSQIVEIGFDQVLNRISTQQSALPLYYSADWQAEHGGGALLMPECTLGPFLKRLARRGAIKEEIAFEVSEMYCVSALAAEARIKKI